MKSPDETAQNQRGAPLGQRQETRLSQPRLSQQRRALQAVGQAQGLDERLQGLRALIPGRILLTTSFGLEDQLLTDAIMRLELAIEIVTLDTGRLFPETYATWAATQSRYGCRIRAYYPDHAPLEELVQRDGINGFYDAPEKRKACCTVRKVAPLARALAGADAWVTGLRAGQSPDRADLSFMSSGEGEVPIKLNPLFDFTQQKVHALIAARDIPYNPLFDQGFASIGCAPCTRALQPGEPERAGRWWWETAGMHKECGLHLDAAGRLVRRAPAVHS